MEFSHMVRSHVVSLECTEILYPRNKAPFSSVTFKGLVSSCSSFQSDQEGRSATLPVTPTKHGRRQGLPLPKGRTRKLSSKAHRQTQTLPAGLDSLPRFWFLKSEAQDASKAGLLFCLLSPRRELLYKMGTFLSHHESSCCAHLEEFLKSLKSHQQAEEITTDESACPSVLWTERRMDRSELQGNGEHWPLQLTSCLMCIKDLVT